MKTLYTSIAALSLLVAGCAPTAADLYSNGSPIVLMPAPYAAPHETYSKSGWEKAYSRRNIKLGTTLDTFLATPFPDEETGHQGHQKVTVSAADIYPVCFNEKDSPGSKYFELVKDISDMAPGVLKCMHFIGSPKHGVRPAKLHMGKDSWMLPTAFYFIQPGGSGDYYLYKISSIQEDHAFLDLRDLLTKGLKQKPVNKQDLVVGGGEAFIWQTATWDNGVSHIELYVETGSSSSLTYALKSLDKLAADRKNKARAVTPGSI